LVVFSHTKMFIIVKSFVLLHFPYSLCFKLNHIASYNLYDVICCSLLLVVLLHRSWPRKFWHHVLVVPVAINS